MANPNNLIRPPILSVNQTEQNRVNMNPQELNAHISRIVSEAIASQVPQLIRQQNNPNNDFLDVPNQIIQPQHRGNLNDLDKIPDVVKSIREFSSDRGEFSSWKKGVDRIIENYAALQGTAEYFGIIHTIRNKIVGNADTVLESYNVPLDWNAISKCLTMHYADKRDLSTLEYQLTTITQGVNQTVKEFHQVVYRHLSLLLNKVGCMELSRESEQMMTKLYRDKALDTFIRGLRGDLPRLLGMKEPEDLPQALHLCLKIENQTYRSNYATGKIQSTVFRPNQKPIPTPRTQYLNNSTPRAPQKMPQRAPIAQQYSRPMHNMTFFSNQAPIQQPYVQQPYAQQLYARQPFIPNPTFVPNRPTAPKPLPRPEPMDVDPSIRTRQVNYMNRPPNFEMGKRPGNPIPPAPQDDKRQRTFNIESNEQNNDTTTPSSNDQNTENEQTEYEQLTYSQTDSNEYGQTLDEYQEQYEYCYGADVGQEQYADLHFLE